MKLTKTETYALEDEAEQEEDKYRAMSGNEKEKSKHLVSIEFIGNSFNNNIIGAQHTSAFEMTPRDGHGLNSKSSFQNQYTSLLSRSNMEEEYHKDNSGKHHLFSDRKRIAA